VAATDKGTERKEQYFIFDYSNDPKFVHNNNLFKDVAHLNAKGANVFTAKLVGNLELTIIW